MKFITRLKASVPLAAALLLAVPATSVAQNTTKTTQDQGFKAESPVIRRWRALSPTERDSLRRAALRNYPMMYRKLAQGADQGTKLLPGGNKGVAKGTSKAIEGVLADWNAKLAGLETRRAPILYAGDSIANSKITYYGYVPASTGLKAGFYKFALGPNPTAELLNPYNANNFGFGSAIVNGKLYIMYVDKTMWDLGWINANYYTVDLTTGTVGYGGAPYYSYNDFAGYATTQAADGTVYGQFFGDAYDPSVLVWGSRDYTSMSKIADFGKSSNIISVALGITSDGKLYSVGEDGNLYQISTKDGTETLVGPTGVTPYKVNGTLAPSSGEIDPKTNTFYWAAVDGDGKAGLYSVNLKTGQATKLSDWGNLGNIEIQSLVGVIPPAEDGAPAAATNLSLSFEGGSTTGKIYFTAPATTYAGQELDDTLDFQVTSGTEVVATGKVFAGDEDSATITVPEGQNTIAVTTSNSVGRSPIAKISQWIGFDQPANVSGASAILDEETGIVTLKWNAPTRVNHNGYLGPLTYNIYYRKGGRASNDTLIAVADTAKYKVQLPENDLQSYIFAIEAVNGTQKSYSKIATSRVAWGKPLNTPYNENFKSDETFSFFKIVNNNGDNYTWRRSNGWAECNSSYGKAQDKWLVTPLINLKGGNDYVLDYTAACNYSWYKGVKYQLKYGKFAGHGRTIEGLDKVIADTLQLDSISDSAPVSYSDTIHIDETGNYAFGFHACSPNGVNCNVKVGPISITKVRLANTPDAVRNLTVTAASNGDNRAQIIFQAPQKDISGNKLTENIPWIALLRNGSEIFRFLDVVPGSYLQYSDEGEGLKVGNNIYSITCYLTDEDPSATVSETAYVGVGIPQPVPEASVVENAANKSLDFSWSPVSSTGANGHKVKVNEVEYGIFSLKPSYFGGYYHDKLQGATTGYSLSVPYDTYVGDPQVNTWAVAAANEAGMSDDYVLSFISGVPKQLPYEEHFSNGAPEVYPLFIHTIDSKWGGYGRDGISSDGDGYSIDAFAQADTITHQPVVSVLSWPKFDLTTAEHPTVIYDINEAVSNGAGKQIFGIVNAGPTITELTPEAVDAQLPNNFKRYKVSLDNYKDNKGLSFGIGARFSGNYKQAWVDIDNVHLLDLRSKNLGIRSIALPANVKGGNTARVKFTVENVGESDASNYVVKAEADGKVFYTDTVSEPLSLLGQKEFTANLPTTIYDESHDIAIKVSVALDGDEVASNDTVTASLPLISSPYPAPEDVAGEQQDENVELTWKAPSSDEATITEGFDDQSIFKPYDIGGINDSTFTGNIGPWTVTTVDRKTTTGPSVNIPNNLVVKSFEVINTDTLGAGADAVFPTLSGAQTLVSFDITSGSTNHWLISPELTGKAQDITINYRKLPSNYGNESFQVLASTGSLETDSFTLVKNQTVNGTDYAALKVSLPEGTKYFAIRHNSGVYGLQLDDIIYTTGSGKPTAYNIYVDGKLVKTLPIESITVAEDGTMSFINTDAVDGSEHQYAVSAVYAGGESRPVPVTINTVVTGIKTISIAPGEKVDIYTIDGKLVRRQASDFSGLNTGVYVVKGQKVLVK